MIYYGAKGIKLNERTFRKNLGLLTDDGKYNILAQLLSDDCHLSIRVAIFSGQSKADNMHSIREFGHQCILFSGESVPVTPKLSEMRNNPNITIPQIAKKIGMAKSSIDYGIAKLKRQIE